MGLEPIKLKENCTFDSYIFIIELHFISLFPDFLSTLFMLYLTRGTSKHKDQKLTLSDSMQSATLGLGKGSKFFEEYMVKLRQSRSYYNGTPSVFT